MTRELCPFCGLHPYEYVDVGIGSIPIAVNCCDQGHDLIVNGADFQELAEPWMAGARATIERYENALRKIASNRDALDADAAALRQIADEALNGPPIQCEYCGTEVDLIFAPNPYAHEINDDDTPLWLCQGCRQELADDI